MIHQNLSCLGKQLIFVILIGCMATNTLGETAGERYQKVKQTLSKLSEHMSQDQERMRLIEHNIHQADMRIHRLSQALRHTQQDWKSKQAIYMKCKAQVDTQQHTLLEQQKTLGQQLRFSYMLGENTLLKLLLSQSNISESERYAHYAKYLNDEQCQQLLAIKHKLAIWQTEKAQAQALASQTRDLLNKQHKQQLALKNQQNNRQHLLKRIERDLRRKQSSMANLTADKSRLEGLIQANQANMILGGPSFSAQRGHLPWPTQGHIAEHFGDTIAGSSWQQTGVVIAALTGKPVHAIAAGKVVFADWLRGFGLLLIVDHGQGYMSIYGRNNSLRAEKGDTVEQGQTIADVGQSGGFTNPGLYFAIRHNGTAVNPALWCEKNSQYFL